MLRHHRWSDTEGLVLGVVVPASEKSIDVCLCLSGQMRCFEPNFNWLGSLDPRINLSIVVATWRQRGGKLAGGMGIKRMRGLFPAGVADTLPASWMTNDLMEHLPGLREAAIRRALEEPITLKIVADVLPNSVIHIEDDFPFHWFEKSQIRNGNTFARDPYSLSMLYKIWQADLLRKNLEADRIKQFDIVIRARPDLPFDTLQYSFLKHVGESDLYIDRVDHDEGTAGDSFALGSSKVMDRFAEFFMIAYQKCMLGRWSYIHNELFTFLIEQKLSLHLYPTKGYTADRLVGTDDVTDAIRRRLYISNLPHDGDILHNDMEASLLCTSVSFAAKLMAREIEITNGDLELHVDNILGSINYDRDCGFFLTLAKYLASASNPVASILCFTVSMLSCPSGKLPDFLVEQYSSELYLLLRNAVSAGMNVARPTHIVDSLLADKTECGVVRSVFRFFLNDDIRALASQHLMTVHDYVLSRPEYVIGLMDQYEVGRGDVFAEETAKCGLSRSPGDGHLNARLAILYGRMGRMEEALSSAIAAQESAIAWVQFLAGKALLLIGHCAEAKVAFNRAIAIFPLDPDFYMELSNAQFRLGEADEAVKNAYEAAARSPETMAHRHNSLGHILRNVGRLQEAEQAFTEAFRRNPQWDELSDQVNQIRIARGLM